MTCTVGSGVDGGAEAAEPPEGKTNWSVGLLELGAGLDALAGDARCHASTVFGTYAGSLA